MPENVYSSRTRSAATYKKKKQLHNFKTNEKKQKKKKEIVMEFLRTNVSKANKPPKMFGIE